MLNKNLFAQTMTMLFELYEKPQTKPLMDIYYNVLSEMEDIHFSDAIMEMIKTRVYPTFPKPAEILVFNPTPIVAKEDEATVQAKELIKLVYAMNDAVFESAKKSGRIFEDELQGTRFTSLDDETIAILNQVKPYTDYKSLVSNISCYSTSIEQLKAFKNAINYSESYSGAIESSRVKQMIGSGK